MADDTFRGMRIAADSVHPKAISPINKSYNPKPGATVQPKAPLAPAETGQQKPPPAKHD
jgi:hypothetical protein